MNFITQEALDNAVLFKLFVHAQTSDKRVTKEDIVNLFTIRVSAKRVDLALENLEAREYIHRYMNNGSTTITSSGYRFTEEQLSRTGSFLRQYADAGDEWLKTQTGGLGGVPASDRIVSRSDNLRTIEEIENALKIIGTELTSNNEVGSSLGDERDSIVGEVEASKTLTQSKSFRLNKLISLLMPALRFISDKFGSGAIADAARRLIQLLLDLT